ncbi:SUKH-4 family immunity protein [Streptomyces sp. NPDC090022]|uniref:SUKH-4 family immunity protein n=1 Tax=Streptomyces sp. NPDC090022 TaxID=3365920 RepID=UPI0037F6CFA6
MVQMADLVEWGSLDPVDEDAPRVVHDPATGRVFGLSVYEDSPEPADLFPLAPSARTFERLVSAREELTSLRGRFADVAARPGSPAVAEATERFRALLAAEDWGDASDSGAGGGGGADGGSAVPAYWRITSVIRPLALVAGPGRGLLLDLPAGLLEEAFGADEVVRLDGSELPDGLRHEPTRRFLTEVGLPEDALMFGLDGPEDLFTALAEEDGVAGVGVDPARLFSLGSLVDDIAVYVDGGTGEIYAWYYAEERLRPLNADISTLAFTLWLHDRERALDEEHAFSEELHEELAGAMVAVLASVDPVACRDTGEEDDWRYWPETFHDEADGVLQAAPRGKTGGVVRPL